MSDVIDITEHDTSEYLQSEANNDVLDGIQWHDSTYEIVSKMAYLLGVPKLYFREKRFYAKYLKTLQFSIKENGDIAATLKNA